MEKVNLIMKERGKQADKGREGSENLKKKNEKKIFLDEVKYNLYVFNRC